MALGPCGGHFGHMEVPMGHLEPLWDHLAPLWEHRGIIVSVMKVALGDLAGALG